MGDEFVFDIDPSHMVHRATQEDPFGIIDRLPIRNSLKPVAKKVYRNRVEGYEMTRKDLYAGVFMAVYCATRELQIPVDLQTIARSCSIGLEKYPKHVREEPFHTWMEHEGTPDEKECGGGKTPLSPQRIGQILSEYVSKGFHVDMTPPHLNCFLKQEIEIQNLQKHDTYIMDFTRRLLEDEFWDDQPPNNLSIAILVYLSQLPKSPFYKATVTHPTWISENVITRLVKLLHSKLPNDF